MPRGSSTCPQVRPRSAKRQSSSVAVALRLPQLAQTAAGVFQYVPAKGQGFPEDFVPFRDLEDAVAARY